MRSLRIACLVSALISVNTQDLTISARTKHPTNFQPNDSDCSSGYYPSTKFKSGTPYKAIPLSYNPSDVCFNTNYYRFFEPQTSPVPQPNIYYVPSNVQPATSAYSSLVWNNSPYTGSSAVVTPQIKNTNPIESSLPHTSFLAIPRLHGSEGGAHQPSNTYQSSKSIKTSRPTISVKIIPPNFNISVTSVTNITSEPDMNNTNQSTQNTKLTDKTRKMIRKLFEMGSRFASKSNRDEKNIDSNKNKDTTNNSPIGVHQSTDIKSQISPSNEMVIFPSLRVSNNRDNEYPLPKTTYKDANEPKVV